MTTPKQLAGEPDPRAWAHAFCEEIRRDPYSATDENAHVAWFTAAIETGSAVAIESELLGFVVVEQGATSDAPVTIVDDRPSYTFDEARARANAIRRAGFDAPLGVAEIRLCGGFS